MAGMRGWRSGLAEKSKCHLNLCEGNNRFNRQQPVWNHSHVINAEFVERMSCERIRIVHIACFIGDADIPTGIVGVSFGLTFKKNIIKTWNVTFRNNRGLPQCARSYRGVELEQC